MSIYDSIGAGRQTGNPQVALGQLCANPSAVLKQAGLTIPAGMNDPQQIIRHLLQSRQVSNPRLQAVQRMMGMMGMMGRR